MGKRPISNIINIFLIIALLFAKPLALGAQEVYGKEIYVNTIDIQMVTNKEASDLQPGLIKMSLKTKEGEPFSQDIFDKDLKFLSQKYDRIEPDLDFKGSKVSIKLKIWPKKSLREIVFEGNERVKSTKLRKQLEVKDNSIFDRTSFNKEFRKLRVYYLKQGFYNSRLNFRVEDIPGIDEVKIIVEVEEGQPGRIDSIKVHGVTNEEEDEVLEMLHTSTYFFLTSWATGSGLYQQEAVDQDTLKVINYFQNLGYADVKVNVKVEDVVGKKEKIRVNINVEKGERYHISKVSFSGNELYDDVVIDSFLELRKDALYSPQKIYKTAENIRKLYGRKGYIDCNVQQQVELDESGRLFSVHFNIKEGEPYRVGLIKVFGNVRTKTSVILHESVINPGELFDLRKVEGTENNLKAMDYFKTVNVYTVEGDSSFGKNFRDVHIEVEEKGTGKFGLFGAYSQHEKLIGGLSFQENNFNVRGIANLADEGIHSLRGGGENFYSKLSMGARDKQTSVAWAKPHFLDTPWTFRIEGDYHYSRLSSDQETKSRNLAVYGIYNLNAFLRTQIFYKISDTRVYTKLDTSRLGVSRFKEEYQSLANAEVRRSGAFTLAQIKTELNNDPANSDKTSDEIDTLAEALYDERAYERFMKPLKDEVLSDAEKGNGVTSSIGAGITYDSTNHPVMPTRGLFSQLTGEFAGVGGDHKFFKLSYENTLYFDITEKLIVKNRFDLHFISPQRSDSFVPFNERLFLGGDFSVRGYKSPILGPRYVVKSPGGSEVISKLTKGGLSSTLISTELDYRLNKYLVPFVFIDVGDLNGKRFHINTLKKFKGSYGAGVQFHILPSMPPVVLGWGNPVKPDFKEDDVGNFFFTIGIHF
ncbi:MAG: outer membrane protein assembly factor BamA [Chlamydiales bacterium]|nr:outer membrane protein assembly factor BamA [Chlamydiales bacterium]